MKTIAGIILCTLWLLALCASTAIGNAIAEHQAYELAHPVWAS